MLKQYALLIAAVLLLSAFAQGTYAVPRLEKGVILENTITRYVTGLAVEASQFSIEPTHIFLGNKFYDLTSASGRVNANITRFNEDIEIKGSILNSTLNDAKFNILGKAKRVQIDGIFYEFGDRWRYISGNTVTEVDVNNGKEVFVSFVEAPPDLNFKKGTFTKTPAQAPASQSITGIGFKPKALMLYTTRQASEGFDDVYNLAIGFSDGTNSRTIAVQSDDDAKRSNTGKAYGTKLLEIVGSGSGNAASIVAEADLVRFDADGFTINWTKNDSTQSIIHYIALGGKDLTNAKVGSFITPGDLNQDQPGNYSVNGTGFQPDFLMFMNAFVQAEDGVGNRLPESGESSVLTLDLGFAKSSTKRGAIALSSADNTPNMLNFRTQRTDRAIVIQSTDVGEADLVSMNPDGFTLNWINPPPTRTYVFYLALKGGQYDVGNFDKSTSPQKIPGLAFQPKGLILASYNNVAQNTTQIHNRLSFGASNVISEGSVWVGDQFGAPIASVTARSTTTQKVIRLATEAPIGTSSTINAEADLQSFNYDGFTLNWTTNDSTATQILYVAFGDTGWDFANDILVNSAQGFNQVESHLVVSGNNDNSLVASLMDFRFIEPDTGTLHPSCRVYSSSDGGSTWIDRSFPSLPPDAPFSGDPVLSTDSNGRFFLTCVGFDVGPQNTVDPSQIIYWISNDVGVNWGSPVVISNVTAPALNDKPWIASDMKDINSPFRDNVYICWTQFDNPSGTSRILFQRILPSTGPLLILASGTKTEGTNGLVHFCSISVGKTGIIYATWVRTTDASGVTATIQLRRSFDGGNSTEALIHEVGTFNRVPKTSGSCNEFWGCLLGSNGTGFRAIPMPYTAIDNDWTLHIVYQNYSSTTKSDALYRKSANCLTEDNSCTFSAPVNVVRDEGLSVDQWEPIITISPKSNTIHITALDRRNDLDNIQWQPWHYNCHLSKFTCGNESDWEVARISSIKSNNLDSGFIGDYHGIAGSATREVHTVWSDSRQGNFDIFSNRRS